MLKNLLILVTLFVISSCQHNNKTTNIKKDDQYQAINNEKQAEKINEETQAKIDEQIEEVEVKDRIFFAYDSAKLTNDAKAILDVQSQWLLSDESINIIIEGHCDERGTREYNIALGEKRASVVQDFLISKGVSKNRIKTISYGKEKPAFFGTSAEIMSKNRRSVTVIN
ncbi:MAG: peptidoglycan-associated lipoprotein [Rickettsiales bacterium]|nr:peptidoglycan-associated lipoprotein [Rickettsiales bacterium]|tara:strand:+ start:21735 stop:22241 length:507 start_codon:yes stop_codon:yes gene_type:complete